MSRYLLLQRHIGEPPISGDPLWRELGTVEATSAESAIRAHLDANKSEVGSHIFIAVPERSAGKIQAEVRQERRVRLGAEEEPA